MRKIIINEVDAQIKIKEPMVDSTPESAPAETKTSKKKEVPADETTSS